MVQKTYLAFINGAIAINSRAVVADRTAFETHASAVPFLELVNELGAQLIRFADRPDGTISGKTFDGDNDDLAMSFMLAVYWRVCVLSSSIGAKTSA